MVNDKMTVTETRDRLIRELVNNDKICAVAQTGDPNAPLIPGSSDIDMFVLCSEIPTAEERRGAYEKFSGEYTEMLMNVCSGGIWGYGDILLIGGIDVMFMYFTIEEMEAYLDEVLHGKHLDREGRFYPVGRLSSVEDIGVLFEREGEWTRLKNKVAARPQELFVQLYRKHIALALDAEDLSRALLRKEVLFFHQVLEEALDHLLIVLFSLNFTYFPSRKRTEGYINGFACKPEDCYDRLLHIVKLASESDTIPQAVEELKTLAADIRQLGDEVFHNG